MFRREPQPGTHYLELDTPALVLDLGKLERNIQKMAHFFEDKPARLRPHAKTHKCPQIALRQLAAGAVGVTCAKIGEAQVLADAGVCDILIANQIVGSTKLERLARLAGEVDLIVAVDDARNVDDLERACRARSVTLRVLVEIDVGMARCGVQPGDAALGLARQVADAPHLEFVGLQAYEGHLVMLPEYEKRDAKVRQAMRPLLSLCEDLEQAGLPARIVSGGGTGTYDITGTCPPFTEVQAGSYVLMDTTYLRIRPEFESSLTVLSTVISRPVPERLVTDAGMKSLTREFGWPEPLGLDGVSVQGLSEEHGKLIAADPNAVQIQPGDKIRFVPSHCCTTVNLYDVYHVCRDERLVDIWSVAARGRSQ